MRIAVRDTHLFFEVIGTKLVADGPVMRERPTLLLLHGGPGFDHSVLATALAPLADTAQLVLLDHRGQGRSDPSSPDRWNLDTWIEDLRAFCEALELERPIVLGQSFGGVVALGLAGRHPDLPAKLIVSSSIAKLRLDRALPMFERLGGPGARALAERYFTNPDEETFDEFMRVCLPLYNPTPVPADVLARVRMRPEVGIHFFRHEGLTVDLFPELGRIRCPTLVLAGELDPITTAADGEDIAAAIPNARLEVFPGAGHGVFRDKPDEAIARIRSFLEG